LSTVVERINQRLAVIDGVIMKVNTDVSSGPAGAYVTVSVAVGGSEPRRKRVVGINERGATRDSAMAKAAEKLNKILAGKKGEVVDVFTKTITTPLPGRIYTTIVAAVNEDVLESVVEAKQRRGRLKKIVELLGNNPSTLNISQVARIYGVSRLVIYKDLEELGYTRTSLKKSH
jgi:hypothetical protein